MNAKDIKYNSLYFASRRRPVLLVLLKKKKSFKEDSPQRQRGFADILFAMTLQVHVSAERREAENIVYPQ